jgi:hypothetical protein
MLFNQVVILHDSINHDVLNTLKESLSFPNNVIRDYALSEVNNDICEADQIIVAVKTHCGSVSESLKHFLKNNWVGKHTTSFHLLQMDSTHCTCCPGSDNILRTWCFVNSLRLNSQLVIQSDVDLALIYAFGRHIK